MVKSDLTVFVVVNTKAYNFLGGFWTREDARAWAVEQPYDEMYVMRLIPGKPEEGWVEVLGPLSGKGSKGPKEPEKKAPKAAPEEESPEVEEAATEVEEAATENEEAAAEDEAPEVEEAVAPLKATVHHVPSEEPKTRKTRTLISEEAVQEGCDKILSLMKEKQDTSFNRKYFLEEASISPEEWTKVIRLLLDNNQVRQEGVKKGATYHLSE